MSNTKVSLLIPCSSDKAISFYGKAILIETDDEIKLQSYNTIVCVFDKVNDRVKIEGYYSMTTGRHIRSFLEYLGLRVDRAIKVNSCRSFKQFIEKFPEFTIC